MKYRGQNEIHAPVTVGGRSTRNYICLVDAYRRPSMRRNTAGRYRVGAKNPVQARRLLQKTIGFGSVTVLCEDNTGTLSDPVPFGTCMKETIDETARRFVQSPARHSSEPVAAR